MFMPHCKTWDESALHRRAIAQMQTQGGQEVSQETFNAQTRDSLEQQLAALRRATELSAAVRHELGALVFILESWQ